MSQAGSQRSLAATGKRLAMPLQFHRAVEDMELWSAVSEGYSFVISYESPPVQAFANAAVIWRRGVRLMKLVAR